MEIERSVQIFKILFFMNKKFNQPEPILAEHIPGLQDIWVLGDEFTVNSANLYFKQACLTLVRGTNSTGTYCGDNFEIKLFHATQYTSHIRDFMSRLCNTLAEAFNDEKRLPRAIIIVLDDDMIRYAKISKYGMSLVYGKILHYLFSEINKLVAAKLDFMPPRARKEHWPELIWINPPFHANFKNNGQQNKFAKALDNTAALYPDNWSLKRKCIWDTQAQDLFIADSNRFTAKGLMTYWMGGRQNGEILGDSPFANSTTTGDEGSNYWPSFEPKAQAERFQEQKPPVEMEQGTVK